MRILWNNGRHNKGSTMRDVDLAYLAGVVDSDGCIRVERLKNHGRSKDGTSYAAVVTIQQVEREAVELAKSMFGGCLMEVKPTAKFPNARPMFRWSAKSRLAATALAAMRPYLRIKAAQADNALALAELVGGLNRARFVGVIPGRTPPRSRTPSELERLEIYFEASRRLNSGELNTEYAPLQQARTAQAALAI